MIARGWMSGKVKRVRSTGRQYARKAVPQRSQIEANMSKAVPGGAFDFHGRTGLSVSSAFFINSIVIENTFTNVFSLSITDERYSCKFCTPCGRVIVSHRASLQL
jgi:hypothetical protein